jgi:hypothetical protein
MAIPGYKLVWYRNPAFGALAADVVISSAAAAAASIALTARGGSFVGPEGLIVGLAFAGAITKAVYTWNDKGRTRLHHGLVGCLHTLDSVLRVSSEQEIEPGLRLTIHTPVPGHGGSKELEQVVDYVSTESRLRKGAGRRFMQQCGILGQAYRTGKPLVAVREQENYEEYIKELVAKWNYSEDQAKALRLDGRSFMAVPLNGTEGVEAVLYLDSSKANFFTVNRQGLVASACVGIALFIGRQYNKNAA